mmetsp:Transcript_23562/g.67674  ORF Transcript_23562/g.67674 Transcript_23562/m.67674 type:complete len:200 (+) Transcript_23562:1794-2393(+)
MRRGRRGFLEEHLAADVDASLVVALNARQRPLGHSDRQREVLQWWQPLRHGSARHLALTMAEDAKRGRVVSWRRYGRDRGRECAEGGGWRVGGTAATKGRRCPVCCRRDKGRVGGHACVQVRAPLHHSRRRLRGAFPGLGQAIGGGALANILDLVGHAVGHPAVSRHEDLDRLIATSAISLPLVPALLLDMTLEQPMTL